MKTPEAQVAGIKQELDKYGLQPIQKLAVKNPFTGEVKEITLDRTGTHEAKLIVALANPDLNREQKDSILSMYMYERGMENRSMLIDLWRYKGQYTTESRLFQSRMRFDFEMFVAMFIRQLKEKAKNIIKVYKIDIIKEIEEFKDWLQLPNNQGKNYTYVDFRKKEKDKNRLMFIQMAIDDYENAEMLRKEVDKVTKARESQQGGGIYVGRNGQAYSVNDAEVEAIIKKDRELQKEAENPGAVL